MGPELRQVVQTIMSDLGMGEDQSKIDALEQYLEENLSTFFSEDSYMSSVIKMGAEKSFTSHSARIKEFLTRGIGGGTIMGDAGPTAPSSPSDVAIGELSPFQKANLSKEETETIQTARAILKRCPLSISITTTTRSPNSKDPTAVPRYSCSLLLQVRSLLVRITRHEISP